MLPAIISVIIVLLICSQIKSSFKFIAFPLLYIPIAVFSGYMVAGLDMLFETMPASQFVIDIGFIGKSCVTEPMLLFTGQSCNIAFALTGVLCILCFIISLFNFTKYLVSQREVNATDSK